MCIIIQLDFKTIQVVVVLRRCYFCAHIYALHMGR